MRTVVRIISLPSATERQARMAESLKPFPEIGWEFFEGGKLSAPGIEYRRERAMISQGRELREGEVGCFVSHYRLWRELLNSEHERFLILEDDAFVDWRAVLPFLERDLGDNIPFLRLYAKRPAISREIGWMCGRRLIQFLHYCYGVQAYIITKDGARRLAEAASVIDRPIDDFMDRSWAHGVPNLCIFPFPVLELEGPSTIGTPNRYLDEKLTRRERLQRLGYRFWDKALSVSQAARELSPMATIDLAHLQGVVTENRVDSY